MSASSRFYFASCLWLLVVACGDDKSATNSDAGPKLHHDAAVGSGKDASTSKDAAASNLDRSACVPDESAKVPDDRCSMDANAETPCGKWLKVEPAGAVCGNGSQYKFFVNYSNTSNNLVVMFEPGGACWDYASCTGKGGIRGAANPDGIPDDHLTNLQYLNLLRRSDDNPAQDYNMVFVSYCTGDVHTGNATTTYKDPDSDATIEYHHAGHANVLKVVEWMEQKFKTVPKLLVTGCSAGGIGALQNYHFIREGLSGEQCGYLLDDSGPAFHSDGPSKQLHETIREVWKLDPLLDDLKGTLPVDVTALKKDFGLINQAIADKYPHDRLALTLYRMDLNYSLYSYQRFFPGSSEDDIHKMWWQDVQELIKTYDSRSNLAYYIPYFRTDNCSHCVSIPPVDHETSVILGQPWLGSEIEAKMLNLKDFTVDLLDEKKPLKSYLEEVQASEMFTSEESMMCMEGGG